MLNHIVLMGRLVRDPELRRTQSGVPVASFRIAVDRDFGNRETGEREADYRTLILLADYFNVSIDYLLERTDNPAYYK